MLFKGPLLLSRVPSKLNKDLARIQGNSSLVEDRSVSKHLLMVLSAPLLFADGLNECRLYCMAKGFRMFVELANRVDDGTPCGKNGNKACFSGICSRARPQVC